MRTGPEKPDRGGRTDGAIVLPQRPNVLAGQQLTSAPKQTRSRRARNGVLGAALALFAENGYDATTVDDIARRAGIAVGGFYLHFRSKRQILLVLMDRFLGELESALDSHVGGTESPERLLTGMHFDSPYAGVYRAWREASLRDASIAALDTAIEGWTSECIAVALRAVARKPGARETVDAETFAWLLNVLWWRSIENLRLDRDALTTCVTSLGRSILFEDAALPREI